MLFLTLLFNFHFLDLFWSISPSFFFFCSTHLKLVCFMCDTPNVEAYLLSLDCASELTIFLNEEEQRQRLFVYLNHLLCIVDYRHRASLAGL